MYLSFFISWFYFMSLYLHTIFLWCVVRNKLQTRHAGRQLKSTSWFIDISKEDITCASNVTRVSLIIMRKWKQLFYAVVWIRIFFLMYHTLNLIDISTKKYIGCAHYSCAKLHRRNWHGTKWKLRIYMNPTHITYEKYKPKTVSLEWQYTDTHCYLNPV